MLRKGCRYNVYPWIKSWGHLIGLGRENCRIIHESLPELGVTQAMHTGQTEKGEHLIGQDKWGRWVCFFADHEDPGLEFVP